MARRVSLKGKGADLFFGDQPPGVDATAAADDLEAPQIDHDGLAPAEAAGNETTSAVEDQAEAAALGSTEPARDEPALAPVNADNAPAADGWETDGQTDAEFFDSMWARLASRASISHSFRYTAPELEEMADVLYEVSKDARARLTKQDIARLGLNVILWDHRRRGAASWLSEFARRKRQPQEG